MTKRTYMRTVESGIWDPLPAAVTDTWKQHAACRTIPGHVFFPQEETPPGSDLEAATAAAKRVCEVCPVSSDCLEFALETKSIYGVWGG